MLKLGDTGVGFNNFNDNSKSQIIRVSESPDRPLPLRQQEGFIVKNNSIPDDFELYIAFESNSQALSKLPPNSKSILLSDEFQYLGDGDVMRVSPSNRGVRVLYRKASEHNNFLVTERCNHYCLMCSQPPRDVEDSWIVEEILEAIPLIDPATQDLGFTGGEPTLLGEDLIRILRMTKSYLPKTAIHILSNGRRFSDTDFVRSYSGIEHLDMMVGIPLYSDLADIHDYVVQSEGAYDETLKGILNLKRYGQKVELRVVIHKQTYSRLPQLAEFIFRNLTFVDHIALMGLEITGFTRANLPSLWIDPIEYQDELEKAVDILANARMNVSIYNHPLCILDKNMWPYARKSISDWKNEYMPECIGCTEMEDCGGFFSSAHHRYSDHIKPFISAS